LRLLGDGAVAPNGLRAVGVKGWVSTLPFFLPIAALLAWTIQRVVGWRGLAVAVLGAVAIIAAFSLVPGTGPHAERAYKNTVLPAVTWR
jgi:Na+-transporting NADH:ubiquinone oxidoreductase subunit NqrB